MHIAMYATNEYVTPLPRGTIHGVVSMSSALANCLAQRGHHIDLFCTKESTTQAHKQSFHYRALINLPSMRRVKDPVMRHLYSVLYSQRMMADMIDFSSHRKTDLLHFHNAQEVMPLLPYIKNFPVIITIHESFFEGESPFAAFLHFCLEQYQHLPHVYLVSISKRQQQGFSTLPFFATAYNGIDTDLFQYNATPKQHVLFSGRFIPEKGVAVALQAAQRAHRQIKVVGLFDPRVASTFMFERTVRQMLHKPNVLHWYKKITPKQLAKLYGEAAALLAPIQWEEPFGLVMVEAMACGTPVIAFKHGAAAELVRSGKTGFVVRTLPEMIRAIKKIPTINRKICRDHVVKNFSLTAMAERYERIYALAMDDYRKRS